mgnify:CR=1 FL=1
MSDYKISEIKTIAVSIAKKYGVKTIYLFGSRARGDNNFHSDYDFLISKGKLILYGFICRSLTNVKRLLLFTLM